MRSSIPASTLEKFATFGDLLRFLRRRAGITQMELASAVGYSDAQISRLEQNLRPPDIPTIEARFVPALELEEEPRAVARLLDLAANVRREDAPGLGLCPYKGLSFFDEADADLFVGREALSSRLAERVLALAMGQSVRFLAVVGASGSGKSSLVRAGLVPALRWNKVSADWNIQVLTPTARPLESLAMSLVQENGSLSSAAALIDDLAREPRSLHLFANRQAQSRGDRRLLLVIDQFEELFALCRSEEERAAFIDNLLTATSGPDGAVLVVITLRADFYAHCAAYPRLRLALASQQEYIGAMSEEELHRSIEEPARRGRWELEPGLVELLMRDVGREPGALPLLSHALLETWQRRRGRTLTLSGYTSSGGVRGAIAETAEAVFTDQFTSEQKAIARRIFLRLTELGDETSTGDTRRRATFDELILKPEETLSTQIVLKALADARLITTSEDAAEVAHEALIREWPTLRGWLEDNREDLRLHRHLTDAAQEWIARGREADVLYRGARLAQAVEWTVTHQEELNALEREFIAASQDLVECEASEKEAQRQRELEGAQKLAETERKRAEEQAHAAGQLRRRSVYLAGAFMLALVMALSALYLGSQARTASRLAASRELAAAALSSLDVDPERSVLLALEAVSKTYTLEAEDALHRSVLTSRVRLTLAAHRPGAPVSVAFSPDGRQLATASPDEVVKVWDAAKGEIVFITAGHFAAFSPDGKKLVTVIADGTVKLWDADSGAALPAAGRISAGIGAAFSPDGSRLATVTGNNLPRIWDIVTGIELANFAGHSEYVAFAAFCAAGTRLLSASDDGTARVWDAASGAELLKLDGHPGWVWHAACSPDGARIATASENEVYLWDASTGEKLFTLTGHKNTVYTVAFSPDGAWLATGSQDRQVKVWNVSTGRELYTLAGHGGAVYSLAFSPDGASLASGSDDGSARLWVLTPAREWLNLDAPEGSSQIAFSPAGDRIAVAAGKDVQILDVAAGREQVSLPAYASALAYSPVGRFLATAGDDLRVKLWDAAAGSELAATPAHTARINALAFSPDGRYLATAGDDYKVKIFAMASGEDAAAPPALLSSFELPAGVLSIAFSADGAWLAAGVQNGTAKIWDLASHSELITLSGHSDSVVSVAFSPDRQHLATASTDGTARIWSTSTAVELFSLAGHTNAVMHVIYSPDGKSLATASRDGSARIWDAHTGQENLVFSADGAGLNSVAFSQDGKFLAASGDTGVRLYLLRISDLVALARGRVGRLLTEEECLKYLHGLSPACARPQTIPTPTPLPPAANGRICQVTNTAGLYDNYFNQLLYKGLQDAASIYGWEAAVLQSASLSDFGSNIRAFAERGVQADRNSRQYG